MNKDHLTEQVVPASGTAPEEDQTMPEETLEALKGSIKKWEAIVAGDEIDRGARNCPLCRMFIDDDCHDCPVSYKANETGCNGTPYDQWDDAQLAIDRLVYENHRKADTSALVALAQAELDFLRSLLPKAKP